MTNFKSINWFRLLVIVSISVVTSLSIFFGDDSFTKSEIVNTLLQAAIVGLAFMQCPEEAMTRLNLNKKE